MKSVLASNGVLMHLDPSDHDYLTIAQSTENKADYLSASGATRRATQAAAAARAVGRTGRLCQFHFSGELRNAG
ncbi:hypothetical protein EVAR_56691_1 [Eumeta japonica]|uniref:Uncharacterized protein n=1 Tax=Eumeta variegata TaxID=151549 RepID=A0A4C2A2C5_EUMVA|nr:hypothetical protein EVAR_56691_1 [Eumeta japonica]